MAAAVTGSIGGAALLGGLAPSPDAHVSRSTRNGPIAVLPAGFIDSTTGERLVDGRRLPPTAYTASWSPDGRRLAFTAVDAVQLVEVAGGTVTRLADVDGCLGSPWWDCGIAWSPDGLTIAVTAHTTLLILDVATGEPRVLLERPNADLRSPAWSPDGSLIAFFDGRSLLIAPFAGGEARIVLEEDEAPFPPRDLGWSPDGRTLAWIAFITTTDPMKRIVVATANADGTDRRELFSAGSCGCLGWGPPGLAWSPDGTKLAIVTHDYPGHEGGGVLLTINADGSLPRVLTSGVQGRPLWQPLP